mgnify:FL=1
MTKQEEFREKYKTIKSKWEESTKIYQKMVLERVNKGTKLLDVGCGHSDLLKKAYERAEFAFGIDPSVDVRSRNPFLKDIRNEYVEKMSFEDNFFDIVVCAWVLEHIENPERAFSEICRVLKPGGTVIFLTPNSLNYNTWIIRLIPERFHNFLTQKFYGREVNDTFSKKYRFNSVKKIRKVMKECGFEEEILLTNGDPSYICFNDVTFRISCLLEKILDLPFLRKFRVHLIGKYKKR